jgi:hypothetical protein
MNLTKQVENEMVTQSIPLELLEEVQISADNPYGIQPSKHALIVILLDIGLNE